MLIFSWSALVFGSTATSITGSGKVSQLAEIVHRVLDRIAAAEEQAGREAGSVRLLAATNRSKPLTHGFNPNGSKPSRSFLFSTLSFVKRPSSANRQRANRSAAEAIAASLAVAENH